MKTREKIWRKGLELFNEQGISQVSVREIARALEISPGNLSYHFQRKEDLLLELLKQLREANNAPYQAFFESERQLADFLHMLQQIFHNQYTFRCIPLGGMELFKQIEAAGFDYMEVQRRRMDSFRNIFAHFLANGQFKADTSPEAIEELVGWMTLMGRFWLHEALITFPNRSREENITHYLRLLSGIFAFHASNEGKASIQAFFKPKKRGAKA